MIKQLKFSFLVLSLSLIAGCDVWHVYSKKNVYSSRPSNYVKANEPKPLVVPSGLSKPDYDSQFNFPNGPVNRNTKAVVQTPTGS